MLEQYETYIIRLVYTTSMMLSFIGAIFLFLRSRNDRARRFHACTMLFLCIWYFLRVLRFFPGNLTQGLGIMNVGAIVIGLFCLLLLSLYPVEVLRPGWLTVRRGFLLSVPAIGSITVFFAGTLIEGNGVAFQEDWQGLWSQITMFNVWSRFLILGVLLCYFGAIVRLVFREDSRYRRWRMEHLPADEASKNDFWLRNYIYWLTLIVIAYLYLVLFGYNPWALLYHNAVSQLFLLYSLYKVLFYDNPYREDFYFAEENGKEDKEVEAAVLDSSADSGERNFSAKLNLYKQEIEQWFEQEHPYFQEDFRLKDVSDRFLLNRSYISRIFNEGYGKSFSLVVREYRLREAERLLLEERDCSVSLVAERCGFSSSSSFIRTFAVEHDGITPGQFREMNLSSKL